MSGVLKKIGKVFKKIVKSKIFKVVLIAAAVYFTAGVALAAGGSAFAASLPGITAAGQAVGLAGVGEIAAIGGTAVGEAALASAGVYSGAADLAAGGLATEGIGSTIAATTAAETALGAADALGAAAEGGGGALNLAPTTSSGFGGVGTDAGVSGLVNKAVAPVAESPSLFGKVGEAAKGVMGWMEKNPITAKAAMTFGSEGLKAGMTAYAQKSQQEAAEERYQQDRVDRQRREAPSTMTVAKSGDYNKQAVQQTAGLDEETA